MWKQLLPIGTSLKSVNSFLTHTNLNLYQQSRTTYILKRRFPPGLHRKWQKTKPLKSRNYVYDVVENICDRKLNHLEVVLTHFVSGIGKPGDVVKMKQKWVYDNLLLPGLAVYASPENIEKYSNFKGNEREPFSSPFVQDTIKRLSDFKLSVTMNKEVPWTLEPWHLRISFRRAGIHLPEEAIKLPEEPITGPNLDLEGKYFEVIVTINNRETVPVKCIIHHWSTTAANKTPSIEDLETIPLIPLFPEKTETKSED